MEFRDYWDAVVRGWWLIGLLGLVGLVVPLLLASPPKGHTVTYYQATSVIGSAPTDQNTSGSNLFGGGISSDQILYYAKTDQVLNSANQLSGLNESLPQMRQAITLVGPPSNSGNSGPSSGLAGAVNVTVVGATPAAALALNQAFVTALDNEVASVAKDSLEAAETQTESTLATVLTDIADNNFAPGLTAQALEVQVNALQNSLAALVVTQPNTGFQVVQAPSAASVSAVTTGTPTVVDNRTVRAVAGLVIGLVLGILAAVALWLLDRRLKTAKRAQTALGYPVVAEIPYESSDSTEAYRMLWLAVFREPLPLPAVDQTERWYGAEDPVLDQGVGSGPGRAGRL
jgi:hypothetical protein